MNLLYVAVNPDLYKHYAGNKAYPDGDYPFPNKVPDVPNYTVPLIPTFVLPRSAPTGWH